MAEETLFLFGVEIAEGRLFEPLAFGRSYSFRMSGLRGYKTSPLSVSSSQNVSPWRNFLRSM
jgi:hypothetical protein